MDVKLLSSQRLYSLRPKSSVKAVACQCRLQQSPTQRSKFEGSRGEKQNCQNPAKHSNLLILEEPDAQRGPFLSKLLFLADWASRNGAKSRCSIATKAAAVAEAGPDLDLTKVGAVASYSFAVVPPFCPLL